MPDTVTIVRFHETGAPEVFQFDQLPFPEPAEKEVRLRVKAIGLNRAESMFRRGQYLETPVLPSTNGYEASGVVEAVGPGVDAGWIGKNVSTIPSFSLNDYGVYGEVAIAPVSALSEYPPNLSYEEAASIWMQYFTAYGALIRYGRIVKGDFVLITAATSSVGLAAIQITKAEGAISIATTRTWEKKSLLLELGADHVIVTDQENLLMRVNEITSNEGARIVFDPIGGKGLEDLAEATSPQGTIFEYGALASEPTPYPLFTALRKRLLIQGYVLRDLLADPVHFRIAKKYIVDYLLAGTFKVRIDKTFSFAEMVEAHRYLESSAQVGKIVVSL